MAFDPNLFEDGMNVDAETHHMVDYEISVEMFLAQRRRWLWRKALTHAWICAALICQSRRHIAVHRELGTLDKSDKVAVVQLQQLNRQETKDEPVNQWGLSASWADTQSEKIKKEWAKQKKNTYDPAKWGHTTEPEKLKKWKKYAEREVERAGASGEAVDVYPKRKTLPRILS